MKLKVFKMQPEKENERRLLLKRIFPAEKLLEIGKRLGDSYCIQFDERGYDKSYMCFSEEEVIMRLSRMLSDEQILDFSVKYKDSLSPFWDFQGNYYTYDSKKREVKMESSWPKIQKEIERLIQKHGENARAFIKACYYICVELDRKWGNYYHIQSKAREFGMMRGWLTMLADFELAGVITWDNGNINIPEEIAPFLRNYVK
jgi:hypothetical protein